MNEREFEQHQAYQSEMIHYLKLIVEKLDELIDETRNDPLRRCIRTTPSEEE